MTPADSITLPISWRSYLRAGFFTGMLLVFGISAAVGSGGALRIIGIALTAIGLAACVDFLLYTQRWRLSNEQLHVPRVWAPGRSFRVSSQWRPDLEDVGRRDSMFVATTGEGSKPVTPNLMVARSDVKQWLFLIGESRRVAR